MSGDLFNVPDAQDLGMRERIAKETWGRRYGFLRGTTTGNNYIQLI